MAADFPQIRLNSTGRPFAELVFAQDKINRIERWVQTQRGLLDIPGVRNALVENGETVYGKPTVLRKADGHSLAAAVINAAV